MGLNVDELEHFEVEIRNPCFVRNPHVGSFQRFFGEQRSGLLNVFCSCEL